MGIMINFSDMQLTRRPYNKYWWKSITVLVIFCQNITYGPGPAAKLIQQNSLDATPNEFIEFMLISDYKKPTATYNSWFSTICILL